MRLPIDGLDWQAAFDEGDIPMSAIAIVKVMGAGGHEYLAYRHTGDLRTWDVIGMLRSMLLDVEQQSIADTHEVDDDED